MPADRSGGEHGEQERGGHPASHGEILAERVGQKGNVTGSYVVGERRARGRGRSQRARRGAVESGRDQRSEAERRGRWQRIGVGAIRRCLRFCPLSESCSTLVPCSRPTAHCSLPSAQCPSLTWLRFHFGMTTTTSAVPSGTHWQLSRESGSPPGPCRASSSSSSVAVEHDLPPLLDVDVARRAGADPAARVVDLDARPPRRLPAGCRRARCARTGTSPGPSGRLRGAGLLVDERDLERLLGPRGVGFLMYGLTPPIECPSGCG